MLMSMNLPLQVITPDMARASVQRARSNLEAAAAEIVWQVEREVWVTLGYRSWSEMREAEYGGAAFMVPRAKRPELIGQLRALGLPKAEIAATAGVGRATVDRDLNAQTGNETPDTITNARGQQRPATYTPPAKVRKRAEYIAQAEAAARAEGDESPSNVVRHMFGGLPASATPEADPTRDPDDEVVDAEIIDAPAPEGALPLAAPPAPTTQEYRIRLRRVGNKSFSPWEKKLFSAKEARLRLQQLDAQHAAEVEVQVRTVTPWTTTESRP